MELKMKGFSRAKLTLNPRNTREENQPKIFLGLEQESSRFFLGFGVKNFRGKEEGEWSNEGVPWASNSN